MTDFTITEDFPESEFEFDQRFHSNKACKEYLAKMKWPEGFRCCNCGHKQYWESARDLYICTRCERPHSLTAGTVMHSTKKPLTYWFKAMWWFTTRKSGVNAVNLKDLLGFGSYQTAWTWLHKLRSCTIRHQRERLSGLVEVDEFYIGGQKPGKRGRGANGKSVIVAAVEKKEGRKIGRIRLQVIPDCSGDTLGQFVQTNVEPGSEVVTDGWKGYLPLDKDVYDHKPVIASRIDDKGSVLPGVHLVASLVKRLMLGTFQGRFSPSHLQSYMDEYVFRFNRRTSRNVGKKFMRISQQVVASTQVTCKEIIGGVSPFAQLAN
jgi:transposase-like protein/DNA-directed RNA polymerase subunit RPC12/RpoP